MASKAIVKRKIHGRLDNYGQHIYLYRHIHTNQVVYSLTQVMNVRTPIAIPRSTIQLTPLSRTRK